jgi:hypothetical protein
MKAPEKIYVADATFPDYVDFDGSPINTKRIDDHDIEYIRTDAFIEKAEEFIYSALNDGIMGTANIEDFMRLFKIYI